MLLAIKPKVEDSTTKAFLNLLAKDVVIPGLNENTHDADRFVEDRPGIYFIGHFNGNYLLPKGEFDEYPGNLTYGSYGVCDNADNLLEKIPELNTSDRLFVVTLTRIRKDEQSPDGGWRWHKWGEYIGKHDPQYEYIYDEPDIEQVYCYHIYEKISIIPKDKLIHGEYYGTSGVLGGRTSYRWDATVDRFKAYVYDSDKQDMVLSEFQYTLNWSQYSRIAVGPTHVEFEENIRWPVEFETKLLGN